MWACVPACEDGGRDAQDREGAGGTAASAAPAGVTPAPRCSGKHLRPHTKSPSVPDDMAISVSPASAQVIPLAPSPAMLERLRRPTATTLPQTRRPKTPSLTAPHLLHTR